MQQPAGRPPPLATNAWTASTRAAALPAPPDCCIRRQAATCVNRRTPRGVGRTGEAFARRVAYASPRSCTPSCRPCSRRQARLGPASGHLLPRPMLHRSHARFRPPALTEGAAVGLVLSPRRKRPRDAAGRSLSTASGVRPGRVGGDRHATNAIAGAGSTGRSRSRGCERAARPCSWPPASRRHD
jgi:hypothetical protein